MKFPLIPSSIESSYASRVKPPFAVTIGSSTLKEVLVEPTLVGPAEGVVGFYANKAVKYVSLIVEPSLFVASSLNLTSLAVNVASKVTRSSKM